MLLRIQIGTLGLFVVATKKMSLRVSDYHSHDMDMRTYHFFLGNTVTKHVMTFQVWLNLRPKSKQTPEHERSLRNLCTFSDLHHSHSIAYTVYIFVWFCMYILRVLDRFTVESAMQCDDVYLRLPANIAWHRETKAGPKFSFCGLRCASSSRAAVSIT